MTETRDIVRRESPEPPANPIPAMPDHVNAGTLMIEQSRAVAEAQGMLLVAKRFPRDENMAFSRAMIACQRKTFAGKATYKFPRGQQSVSGPSIRLAETLARTWGNIEYGIRELSQREGESEMEAFAWDTETNLKVSRRFVVKHERLANNTVKPLTDPRDIYEKAANDGARRLRSCILAVLPSDLVEDAVNECRRTLLDDSKISLPEKVKRIVLYFQKEFGVSTSHLEQYLGVKLSDVLPENLADLQEVFNSLQGGATKPSDWFDVPRAAVINADAQRLTEQILKDSPEPAKGPEWKEPAADSAPGELSLE